MTSTFVQSVDAAMDAHNLAKIHIITELVRQCPDIKEYLERIYDYNLICIACLGWRNTSGAFGTGIKGSSTETTEFYLERAIKFFNTHREKFYSIAIDLKVNIKTHELDNLSMKFYIERQEGKRPWIETAAVGQPTNRLPHTLVRIWENYYESQLKLQRCQFDNATIRPSEITIDSSMNDTKRLTKYQNRVNDNHFLLRKTIERYYYILESNYIEFILEQITNMLTENQFRLLKTYIESMDNEEQLQLDQEKHQRLNPVEDEEGIGGEEGGSDDKMA